MQKSPAVQHCGLFLIPMSGIEPEYLPSEGRTLSIVIHGRVRFRAVNIVKR